MLSAGCRGAPGLRPIDTRARSKLSILRPSAGLQLLGLVAPHDAKMPKKGTPPRLRLGPCARKPRPGPRWAARPGFETSTGGSLCPMLSVAAAAPGGRRAARGAAPRRCSPPCAQAVVPPARTPKHAASPGGRDLRLAQQPGVENTHDGKAKSSDAKQSRPTERSGTHAGRGHLGSGVSTGNATLRWYGPTPVAQSDWPRDTSAKYRGPTP